MVGDVAARHIWSSTKPRKMVHCHWGLSSGEASSGHRVSRCESYTDASPELSPRKECQFVRGLVELQKWAEMSLRGTFGAHPSHAKWCTPIGIKFGGGIVGIAHLVPNHTPMPPLNLVPDGSANLCAAWLSSKGGRRCRCEAQLELNQATQNGALPSGTKFGGGIQRASRISLRITHRCHP